MAVSAAVGFLIVIVALSLMRKQRINPTTGQLESSFLGSNYMPL